MGGYELMFKKKGLYTVAGVVILGLLIGKYYICLPSRTYIKITDKELVVHKGLAWGNRVIKFVDIEEVRLLGNKVFFMLPNNP